MFKISRKFLSALVIAYLKARRHKRWKNNTLQFSIAAEKNIIILASEIKKRTYQIKPSLCFIAFEPVKREIFAGDFRDRIVHHLVFNELAPIYDRLFIDDCYSCRKKRGTDYGIKRIASFLRAASRNYHRPAYILKLDISGYFMNIDRRQLYQKNKDLVRRLFKRQPEKMNILLYLLKLIIFNNPTQNCLRRGRPEDWQGLPKNKSLFWAAPQKGLPIGNLTSQLFGNVYLNDFDHFVKKKLKCRWYGRYVDDMVFVSEDKEFLKNIIPKIGSYLEKNLGLSLHPKKIYLQSCEHGLKFLGTIIKPHRIYIGARVKQNFYQTIRKMAKDKIDKKAGFDPAVFNSYLGLMKKYQTYNLRRKMLNLPETKTALKKRRLRADDNYRQVFYVAPR